MDKVNLHIFVGTKCTTNSIDIHLCDFFLSLKRVIYAWRRTKNYKEKKKIEWLIHNEANMQNLKCSFGCCMRIQMFVGHLYACICACQKQLTRCETFTKLSIHIICWFRMYRRFTMFIHVVNWWVMTSRIQIRLRNRFDDKTFRISAKITSCSCHTGILWAFVREIFYTDLSQKILLQRPIYHIRIDLSPNRLLNSIFVFPEYLTPLYIA